MKTSTVLVTFADVERQENLSTVRDRLLGVWRLAVHAGATVRFRIQNIDGQQRPVTIRCTLDHGRATVAQTEEVALPHLENLIRDFVFPGGEGIFVFTIERTVDGEKTPLICIWHDADKEGK